MNFVFLIISLVLISGFVGSVFAQQDLIPYAMVVEKEYSAEDIAEMKNKAVLINTNEGNLRVDLENKKNQKISFNNILYIESKEKVWGSVLYLDIIEGEKEKKFQFSVVQDWVKYPLSAPTKFF